MTDQQPQPRHPQQRRERTGHDETGHRQLQTGGLEPYSLVSSASGSFSIDRVTGAMEQIFARGPFLLRHAIAVFDGAYGDNGKGKVAAAICDRIQALTGRADAVAVSFRVNGGANAGHTVIDESGTSLALNILPSAVVNLNVATLGVGRSVVIDPRKLLWEVSPIDERYNVSSRLLIDRRTQVSLLTDRILNLADEIHRKRTTGVDRGSTGWGISNAYAHQALQMGIPYSVFQDAKSGLQQAIESRVSFCLALCREHYRLTPEEWRGIATTLTERTTKQNRGLIEQGVFNAAEFDFSRFFGHEPYTLDCAAITEATWTAGRRFADNVGDLRDVILTALRENRYVIGEHGQGARLDRQHGYLPNVTASITGTRSFGDSCGISAQIPTSFVMTLKSFLTTVGTHNSLTKMPDDHPLCIGLSYKEKGVTTGRQRAVYWPDMVEVAESLAHEGASHLVINKLDQLGFQSFKDREGRTISEWNDGTLRICVAYLDTRDNSIVHQLPDTDLERGFMRPVYEEYEGWSAADIKGASWDNLPESAKLFIAGYYRSCVELARLKLGGEMQLPILYSLGLHPDGKFDIYDAPEPLGLLYLASKHGKGGLATRMCERDGEIFVLPEA